MLLAVLVLLAIAGMAHGHDEPESGQVCLDDDDCPPPEPCYHVTCALPEHGQTISEHEYAGECVYTRLNVSECCLTDEECCEYAGPHETGYCNHNCNCSGTCLFVPDRECAVDADCDARLSALICRAQGECFRPYCDASECRCFNGTGVDLDQDGVPCPEDCDDTDPHITTSITCLRDKDNDNYPECGPILALNGEEERCMQFCVEPNHTCPYGYTDVTDPLRWYKDRSHRRDTGVPCNETAPEDDDDCDCCDIDKRAYPNSMYTASRPNNCGDPDYNCDGETDVRACCIDGFSDAHAGSGGPRFLWFVDACVNGTAIDVCGGCETINATADLALGWACESECDSVTPSPVPPGACPNACNGECDCVDDDQRPVTGRCGKFVTSCVQVRTDLFADHEECCVSTVQ